MPIADRFVVTTQPDAADREPAIAMALRNLRFLQQFDRAAAGADENELGQRGERPVRRRIFNFQLPGSAILALQTNDPVLVEHLHPGLGR